MEFSLKVVLGFKTFPHFFHLWNFCGKLF